MSVINFTSTGPVGMLNDAFEQGSSLANMSERERAPITADTRSMEKIYNDAATTIKAARSSDELAELGKRVTATRALQQAAEAMKPHDLKVAKINATAAEVRAKAIEPPAAERTQEVLMLEREIRDRLAGKDALEINVTYMNAITKGDWTTVNAIERAPAAFALITADQREVGDMMKLRASPLASQVIEADRLAFIYGSVASTVHAELGKLADQFGGADLEG